MKPLFLPLFLLLPCWVFAQADRNATGFLPLQAFHPAELSCKGSNPALLYRVRRWQGAVSVEQRFALADLRLVDGFFSFPLKKGSVGMGASRFGNEWYNETGLSAGYGRELGGGWALGLRLNYYRLQAAGYAARSFLNAETGLAWTSGGFTIGLQLYDPAGLFEKQRTGYGLSSSWTLAAGGLLSEQLFAAIQLQKQAEGAMDGRFLLLYGFHRQAGVLAGWTTAQQMLSVGAYLCWNGCRVQLSNAFHPRLGYSPTFTLACGRKPCHD